MYWATTTYKLWVRRRLLETGWSLEEFADRIKQVDRRARASSGGLSQFLGPDHEIPQGSNTTLMPAMNAALGASPPPVCDPESPLAQLFDAIASRWLQMTETEKQVIEAVVGIRRH